MVGGGEPRDIHTSRFSSDNRGVTQTVTAVVVVAIAVGLVAVSVTMLTGVSEEPAAAPQASTDVELGPGGVSVELQAVSNADSIAVRQGGELLERISAPAAGTKIEVDASELDDDESIQIVGENGDDEFVIDTIDVSDEFEDGDGGSGSGSGGSGSAGGGATSASSDDGTSPDDGSSGPVHVATSSSGGSSGGASGGGNGGGSNDDSDDSTTFSVDTDWQTTSYGTVGTVDSGEGLVAGNESGAVTMVNRSDGRVAWSSEVTSAAISGVATGAGDDVYVGTEDGTVRRLSADGSTDWTVDVPDRADAGENASVESVTVADDGSVYATVAAYNDTTASAVTRLDANGSSTWTYAGDGKPVATAVSDDGSTYLATRDAAADETQVVEVDENGTTAWSQSISRPVTAVDTVGGGVTYAVASNGTAASAVRRLDRNGDADWNYSTGTDATVSAVAFNEGRTLLGFDGATAANVRAVDPDGSLVWDERVTDASGSGALDVTALSTTGDGEIYVGGTQLLRLNETAS
jgi:outer membrane protein assembly factor BamB/Flp pilus assembly pilin Flp